MINNLENYMNRFGYESINRKVLENFIGKNLKIKKCFISEYDRDSLVYNRTNILFVELFIRNNILYVINKKDIIYSASLENFSAYFVKTYKENVMDQFIFFENTDIGYDGKRIEIAFIV